MDSPRATKLHPQVDAEGRAKLRSLKKDTEKFRLVVLEQVSASQAGARGREATWRIVENVAASAQLRSKTRVQLRPQRQWIAWH